MKNTAEKEELTVYKYAISIIIPVYNAEEFIEETMDSILSQQFSNYEILLIDDCSTDNSKGKITSYLTDNIHYFCEKNNTGGPSIPRNTGVQHAQGKYILFFDSDDLMLPNKLSLTFQALEENDDVGLLCSNFQSIDPKSNIINKDFLSAYQSFRCFLNPIGKKLYQLESKRAYRSLLEANFIGTSSVTIPKKVLDKIGRFDESLTNGDDLDMWFRIANEFNIIFADEILHQYRVQPNSISFRGGNKNSLNRIRVLEKQLIIPQNKENLKWLHYWLSINYSQAGTVELRKSEGKQARLYLGESIRYRFTLSSIKYYLASFLNHKLLNILKKLKN